MIPANMNRLEKFITFSALINNLKNYFNLIDRQKKTTTSDYLRLRNVLTSLTKECVGVHHQSDLSSSFVL